MEISAHAKLNLLLNVIGKKYNGYHSLETVMCPLELHDKIIVNVLENSDKITISTNNNKIPTDETNILYKCANLFQEKFSINDGFEIFIDKKIPLFSGLGGESTDAAALMRFYNVYYNLKLNYSDIFYLGRLLGWDVPICYFNKCIYINDIKSVNEFVEMKYNYYILLIQPNYGISTKEAFTNIDKTTNITKSPIPLIDLLINNDNIITENIHNCFINADKRLVKDFNQLKEYCNILNFDGISMTGTGSCFYFITKNKNIANNGFGILRKKYPYVELTKTLI